MAIWRKSTCELVRFRAELASLSIEYYFCLKEQLTDKLWLFRLGYLADIFLKKEIQGKQSPVFLANNKIQAFK